MQACRLGGSTESGLRCPPRPSLTRSSSRSERAAGHDADAGVGAELGRADDPLDVERLFLEFVERDLVDVGLADDLEDLLVDPRAEFLDLDGTAIGVDDELLGDGPQDVEQAGDARA